MFTFVSQVLANYPTTGAVLPSSPVLGRAMTAPLRRHPGPKRMLEVGPGTGVFTRHMLRSMGRGDELHVVELNPRFCSVLEQRVLQPFVRANPGVKVVLHACRVEEAPIEGPFHFIVCGLPFNNLPLGGDGGVRAVFRHLLSMLHEDGVLTYFEYLGMQAVKMPWVGARGREQLRRRIALKKMLDRRHLARRELVIRNIPPAHAIHLQARR